MRIFACLSSGIFLVVAIAVMSATAFAFDIGHTCGLSITGISVSIEPDMYTSSLDVVVWSTDYTYECGSSGSTGCFYSLQQTLYYYDPNDDEWDEVTTYCEDNVVACGTAPTDVRASYNSEDGSAENVVCVTGEYMVVVYWYPINCANITTNTTPLVGETAIQYVEAD